MDPRSAVLIAVTLLIASDAAFLKASGLSDRRRLLPDGQWTDASPGAELTDAQKKLLDQLQAETALRGAERKLAGLDIPNMPAGVGFPAPPGAKVPTLPIVGSKDDPSIDIFSWPVAAKMEGMLAVS